LRACEVAQWQSTLIVIHTDAIARPRSRATTVFARPRDSLRRFVLSARFVACGASPAKAQSGGAAGHTAWASGSAPCPEPDSLPETIAASLPARCWPSSLTSSPWRTASRRAPQIPRFCTLLPYRNRRRPQSALPLRRLRAVQTSARVGAQWRWGCTPSREMWPSHELKDSRQRALGPWT